MCAVISYPYTLFRKVFRYSNEARARIILEQAAWQTRNSVPVGFQVSLDSLSGRRAVVALVGLSVFCALGAAYRLYVLMGTQRALNRQRRASTQGQKSSSRHWWR